MKIILALALTFVLCLCLPQPVLTQPSQEHLEKYWYYRERLKNDFIYYTDDPGIKGSHQPIECRADYYSTHPGDTRKSFIRMGDAGDNLGHYIGMLALEWKLLTDNGQFSDALETIDELDKALSAFDRLDGNAENCFREEILDPIPATDYNGFFLRDDMGGDTDEISAIKAYFDVKEVYSGYISECGFDHGGDGDVISQDQAVGMFFGLMMVKNYVQIPYYQDKAVDLTNKIIDRMHSPGLLPVYLIWMPLWQIQNPVTEEIVPAGGSFWDLYALCWAHATVAGLITGEDEHINYSYYPPPLPPSPAIAAWNESQNIILSYINGETIEIDVSLLVGGVGIYEIEFPEFNARMISLLSTLANEWGNGPDNLYDWTKNFCNDTQGMFGMPTNIGVFPHLPLLAKLLYGYSGSELIPADYYEVNFFETAPACGAFHYVVNGVDITSYPPWHTLSLLSPYHWETNGYDQFDGDYTMMDYMIMYNAYFCDYYDDPKPYTLVTLDYPDRSNSSSKNIAALKKEKNFISNRNPYPDIIQAPRRIDAVNTLYPDADVWMKAGQEVHLLPGFHAYYGSSLHAFIDEDLNFGIYYEKTTTDPCGQRDNMLREQLSQSIDKTFKGDDADPGLSPNIIETSRPETKEKSVQFVIYPNPTKGTIFIECFSGQEILKIVILNSTGNQLRQIENIREGLMKFDLSSMPGGIYFLKIITKDDLKVIKLVKQ